MRSLANIFNLGIKEFRSLGRDYAMLALIVWAFTLGVYSSATGIPETLRWSTRTARSSRRVSSMPSSPHTSGRRK
jgi:hypothetical protein